MPLSEDLAALETWVACIEAGTHEWTEDGLHAFRLALGHAAERAERLERTLRDTADELSPPGQHAAVLAGIASGKVELLAHHRVQRLPDLDQPGLIA